MNAALRHAAAMSAAFLGLTAAPALAQTASNFDCSAYEFNTALPAIEGKDGVFFRTFADLRMQHPLDDRTVHMMGQLAKVLKENGTTLLYVTIPSKSQGMPQYLPEHATDYGFQPQIADAIYTDFIARLNAAGVEAPDLMTALRSNKGGERALFGADFHWTSQGARLGAQAIAEQIKADPAYEDLPKKTFVTKAIAPEVAFSGMRRTLQGYCAKSLPPTETMAYKTEAAVSTDDAAGGLDIFAAPATDEVLPAVLVGTSYSDSPDQQLRGLLGRVFKAGNRQLCHHRWQSVRLDDLLYDLGRIQSPAPALSDLGKPDLQQPRAIRRGSARGTDCGGGQHLQHKSASDQAGCQHRRGLARWSESRR